MRVAQGVEFHARQLLRYAKRTPRPADGVRATQLALYVAKHERVRLDWPQADGKAQLHLLHLVRAEHGHCLAWERDLAPPALCLWRLEAQAGLGLLDASLHAQRGGIQVYVAPLKTEQLAATQACREIDSDNKKERVTGKRA